MRRKWRSCTALFVAVLLVWCTMSPAVSARTIERSGFWSELRGRLLDRLTPYAAPQEFRLLEDETTVQNGDMLRASTYALMGAAPAAEAPTYTEETIMLSKLQEQYTKVKYYYLKDGSYYRITMVQKTGESYELRSSAYSGVVLARYTENVSVTVYREATTVKYFPITMYNYKEDVINNATYQADYEQGVTDTWNGIYFSSGSPGTVTRSFTVEGEGAISAHTTLTYADVREGANTYYFDSACTVPVYVERIQQDEYTPVSPSFNLILNYNTDSYVETPYYVKSGDRYYPVEVRRKKDGGGYKYKFQYNEIEVEEKTQNLNSTPQNVKLYVNELYELRKSDGTVLGSSNLKNTAVGRVLYSRAPATTHSITARVGPWNWWNKDKGNNQYGQYTYAGLVQPQLTATRDIVFTKPDGGIFNADTRVKDIYTAVELPFIYDPSSQMYSFDASRDGVYFKADAAQQSTAPQSNGRLYLDRGKPQGPSLSAADGSKGLWAPFNSTAITNSEQVDFHFGMRTTIPFTMTADGRMRQGDESSAPIRFTFSGDDDVWIFIDGHLVVDLGGIHNRLAATIDFAANTWEIQKDNTLDYSVGAYSNGTVNTTDGISGKVFNEGGAVGKLEQSRETFAAADSHELTIFYLERGKGSSNCKIEFNLPMKDYVSVTKLVEATDSAGLPIPESVMEQLRQRDFGFTLYKNGTPVSNTTYNLLSVDQQVISMPSTDANGHFTLRTGQTAKFVGEMGTSAEYYVVEDKDPGADDIWQVPVWEYSAHVANGTSVTESTEPGRSMTVQTHGSVEAEDSLSFECRNRMLHQDTAALQTIDDRIVIDYGLPVIADVLANDTAVNGVKTLVSVQEGRFGTAEVQDGKIRYCLTRPLTEVEILTYEVHLAADSGLESDNKTATGTLYIIPATSMYYEEDFPGLVDFSKGNWEAQGTASNPLQEPGVVGTVGDSPYGSDVAYLDDRYDSNGTSKYVSTVNGAAQFAYTFKGTGTTFFARTSNTTGFMRVVVTDAAGTQVAEHLRDTSYKTTDNSLMMYNIPVYTVKDLPYGTYTVTVTIANKNGADAVGAGTDFWLDGVRVLQPIDPASETSGTAYAAYAADGEANMAVVTLREKLIREAQKNEDGTISWNEGDNFVVFTDTNGEITSAEEYRSNGPKEEVYLHSGQSVTFSLYDWDPNTNRVYLGAKVPLGGGGMLVNGHGVTLYNAADCCFNISAYAEITVDDRGIKTATFTVTAAEGCLLSLTNIKVTGNAVFTIVQNASETDSGGEA